MNISQGRGILELRLVRASKCWSAELKSFIVEEGGFDALDRSVLDMRRIAALCGSCKGLFVSTCAASYLWKQHFKLITATARFSDWEPTLVPVSLSVVETNLASPSWVCMFRFLLRFVEKFQLSTPSVWFSDRKQMKAPTSVQKVVITSFNQKKGNLNLLPDWAGFRFGHCD